MARRAPRRSSREAALVKPAEVVTIADWYRYRLLTPQPSRPTLEGFKQWLEERDK